MSTPADMTERHAAALAEFAELCLSSARDLAARQLAAETAEDAAALASALHKVGRSLRQSMALEARLRRDQDAAPRERAIQAANAELDRQTHRKAQVCATVARLIWTEASDEHEAERLLTGLTLMLDEESLAEGFGDEPLDDHIDRICGKLLNRGDLSEPELSRPPPPIDDDHWRSSA